MGSARRIARPAGLLAAYCRPRTSSSAFAALRLQQQCRALSRSAPRARSDSQWSDNDFILDGAVISNQSPRPSRAIPDSAPSLNFNDTAPLNRSKSVVGIVEWNEDQLRFRYWDGEWNEDLVFSALWLRDSCPCHQCVDPDSGQKNFSTTDLPDNPTIADAKLRDDRSLEIVWANDAPSAGASHTSVFPAKEVEAWGEDVRWQRDVVAKRTPQTIHWDRAAYEALLAEGRCRVSYKDWMNDDATFWDAFTDLRQTGLIFVTDVPPNETEVERIATRIAPLQHTFYGWTWDVRSKPQAENVAYTSKFLGLHQDLMYHDPIPALQLLHCLSNSCEGGESLFSNGVRAAYELKLTQRDKYKDLTKLKSWFGYRKGAHHYFATRHTISQMPDGHPKSTRWAPPFQATFQAATNAQRTQSLQRWKQAAAAFQAIVESEDNMVEVKLREGECVIFDNRTILHGRRQFATTTSTGGAGNAGGGGSRWLKGAYISAQNYGAATTRLLEYMEAAGMDLPSSRNEWNEEAYVRRSLQLRMEQGSPGRYAELDPMTASAEGFEPWDNTPETAEDMEAGQWTEDPEAPEAPESTEAKQ